MAIFRTTEQDLSYIEPVNSHRSVPLILLYDSLQ
jgi:hypothetical protein